MTTPHTMVPYGRAIRALEGTAGAMADLVLLQLDQAISLLADADMANAGAVHDREPQVSALRDEIENESVRLIARYQPVADDLRRILAAARYAIDLERIGDHAANIARRALEMDRDRPSPLLAPAEAYLRVVAGVVLRMRDLLKEPDAGEATALHDAELKLDHDQAALERATYAAFEEGGTTARNAAQLMRMTKRGARIGDHCANIAETVFWRVTGHRLANEQHKKDTTDHLPV